MSKANINVFLSHFLMAKGTQFFWYYNIALDLISLLLLQRHNSSKFGRHKLSFPVWLYAYTICINMFAIIIRKYIT